MFNNIFNIILNDAPQPWQIGFQDSATPGFSGIVELHNTLFFYLIIVVVGVFWVLASIAYYFNSNKTGNAHKYLNHGMIECQLKSFSSFNYLNPRLSYKVMIGGIRAHKKWISSSPKFPIPLGIRYYSSCEKKVDFYEWLSGLTDGEGSFYFVRRNETGTFDFKFQICLHVDDIQMLHFIQKTIGIGKVASINSTARFSVTTLEDIQKIIDIFSNHPLNSTKLLNFLCFKKAFELYISSHKKKDIIKELDILKSSMNTQRTDFNFPESYKPRITPYWLLGFVEGEGSFFVRKDQYKLTFTLTQSSRDLALMLSIKDFIYNLPGINKENMDDSSIRISITQSSTDANPITQLIITKTDLIRSAIIPFFSSITWRSKKELDFQDWVTIFKIKERGHHYQEEGMKILNLIISQMNNNRLSSNRGVSLPKVEREHLYLEIKNLLDGPSNIEVKKDGRLFIKSLNSFYKGSGKVRVEIKDKDGLVLNTFASLSDCAKFLGVSQPTAKNRLLKSQFFLFQNKPYIIKLINKDSDSLLTTKAGREKTLSNVTKIKVSTKLFCVPGNPVNVYEKCSSEGFKLIGSFVSVRRAGLFLGISASTITKYVQSGQIYKDRYKFSSK